MVRSSEGFSGGDTPSSAFQHGRWHIKTTDGPHHFQRDMVLINKYVGKKSQGSCYSCIHQSSPLNREGKNFMGLYQLCPTSCLPIMFQVPIYQWKVWPCYLSVPKAMSTCRTPVRKGYPVLTNNFRQTLCFYKNCSITYN